MEYEEILEELQTAIRGIEMNTQFLLLFSYKQEIFIGKHSGKTIEDCKKEILNSAKQYTYDYLLAVRLLLDCKK